MTAKRVLIRVHSQVVAFADNVVCRSDRINRFHSSFPFAPKFTR